MLSFPGEQKNGIQVGIIVRFQLRNFSLTLSRILSQIFEYKFAVFT